MADGRLVNTKKKVARIRALIERGHLTDDDRKWLERAYLQVDEATKALARRAKNDLWGPRPDAPM